MKSSWRLLRGGAIGIAGRAFLIGIQFISHVVLARALGSAGYGVLSLAIPIVVVSAFIARAGIPRTLQKYIPAYLVTDNAAALSGLLRWSMRWLLVIGVVVTAILLLSASILEAAVFPHADLAITLRVVAISLIFINLVSWFGALGLSIGQVRLEVLGQHIIQPVAFLVLVIAAVLTAKGQLSAITAAIALSFSWSLTALLVWQQSSSARAKVSDVAPVEEDSGTWAGFSVRAALPELANQARFWIDLLIAGALLASETIGVLAVCLRIAYMPLNILAAFGSIFLHQISELHAQRNMLELRNQYANITFSALSLSLPFICLLFILAPSILAIFGDEFRIGAATLMVILMGQVIVGLLGPCWPVMLLMDSERELLAYSVGAIVLSILLCVVLIPKLGILGAGISNAIALATLSASQIFHLFRKYRITPFRSWSFRLLPPLVLAILAELLRQNYWPVPNELLDLAATVATFGGVYFGVSVLAGVWQVALVGDVLYARKDRNGV